MVDQLEELEGVAPGLVERLGGIGGVEGVVLGGSRARGSNTSGSDFDVGLYYRAGLDVRALQALAADVSEVDTIVTHPGGWGPWVDGGAWLVVSGIQVDLIYREVDRVADVWIDCQAGRFTNEIQPGHPLGFWSHAYAGELALSLATDVMSQRLAELKAETAEYPTELSGPLVAALWEASFSVANARKAIDQLDVAYVGGCLFRAAGVAAHAVHGYAGAWLVNEKGAVASASRLSGAGELFAERVAASFSSLRPDAVALDSACRQMEQVIADVVARTAQ